MVDPTMHPSHRILAEILAGPLVGPERMKPGAASLRVVMTAPRLMNVAKDLIFEVRFPSVSVGEEPFPV